MTGVFILFFGGPDYPMLVELFLKGKFQLLYYLTKIYIHIYD